VQENYAQDTDCGSARFAAELTWTSLDRFKQSNFQADNKSIPGTSDLTGPAGRLYPKNSREEEKEDFANRDLGGLN